jgi:SAM-dependent methyltransferase
MARTPSAVSRARLIGAKVKGFIKRLLRPFVKPLLARFAADEQQISQVTHLLPVLLNAIATQNATARDFERWKAAFIAQLDGYEGRMSAHAAQLDDHERRLTTLGHTMTYVDRRGEFLRRELMYEARYGARSRGIERVEELELDVSTFATNGPLRLNLGSGHIPREGFMNVDARDLDGVDLVADVRKLPFEPGTVEEIYSSHLVEHFPVEELRRVVLPHWLDLLRPGGRFVAITPDAEKMLHEAAAARMPFDDFQRVTFGDQEYDGDFHFAMFTPDSFASLLAEVGFSDVDIVDRARRNGLCYEFEITANAPLDPT